METHNSIQPVPDNELPTEKDLQRAVQIQTVVNGLSEGKTTKAACEAAGITPRTWRNWKQDGHVRDVISTRFQDITSGVSQVVADALVESTLLLVELSCGRIPEGTDITGTLAPRDIVAAQQQLARLWERLGGDLESGPEAEQERLLEELQKQAINIQLVHVETVNVGDESQPIPIPSGVRAAEDVVEGELAE